MSIEKFKKIKKIQKKSWQIFFTGYNGVQVQKTKAMKRRVQPERFYREPPVAAKEEMRKGWKMVLEPRTERVSL